MLSLGYSCEELLDMPWVSGAGEAEQDLAGLRSYTALTLSALFRGRNSQSISHSGRAHALCPARRVCVDLCSLLVAGEGLLVGSFAGGLFLVHSECAESAYINSRPFRVNAGPVRWRRCLTLTREL